MGIFVEKIESAIKDIETAIETLNDCYEAQWIPDSDQIMALAMKLIEISNKFRSPPS